MNTTELTQEQISAFADGEVADSQIDAALAALRHAKHGEDWALYHQIGDVLRSEDMAFQLSPGFATRMAARLEAEPPIVAPVLATASVASSSKRVRQWAMPSMVAAAAVATMAFVLTPQLATMWKGEALVATVAPTSGVTETSQIEAVAIPVAEGVILRDPRIDDYLLAHQRFSPSVYSTAQYARSATFSSK